MILQVFPDACPIGDDADAEIAQKFSGADTGALENSRRMERAGGENDFRATKFLAGRRVPHAHPAPAPAVEQYGLQQKHPAECASSAAAAPAASNKPSLTTRGVSACLSVGTEQTPFCTSPFMSAT